MFWSEILWTCRKCVSWQIAFYWTNVCVAQLFFFKSISFYFYSQCETWRSSSRVHLHGWFSSAMLWLVTSEKRTTKKSESKRNRAENHTSNGKCENEIQCEITLPLIMWSMSTSTYAFMFVLFCFLFFCSVLAFIFSPC